MSTRKLNKRQVRARLNATADLMRALGEWKDAGAPAIDVVIALDEYLRDRVPFLVALRLQSGKKGHQP